MIVLVYRLRFLCCLPGLQMPVQQIVTCHLQLCKRRHSHQVRAPLFQSLCVPDFRNEGYTYNSLVLTINRVTGMNLTHAVLQCLVKIKIFPACRYDICIHDFRASGNQTEPFITRNCLCQHLIPCENVKQAVVLFVRFQSVPFD